MKQLNILETLANMNIEGWSESEYFIMPNIPQPNPESIEAHLGFYVLFICVKGEVEIFINNQPTKIEHNCLYALSPGNAIKHISQSEDCRLRILAFTKDFLLKQNYTSNELADFDFFTNNQHNKINLNKEEATSLFQLYDLLNIKKEKTQNSYHLEIIRSLFFTFLYEIKAIYSINKPVQKSINNRENELNDKFKELVNSQAKMQHSLRFYADSLFITPKYLITAIKNASGKTPKTLINETIIEEAKQYLVHTNLTISEICESLQFSDIAAFSKFFKQHTSLSPSAFRKKYQA